MIFHAPLVAIDCAPELNLGVNNGEFSSPQRTAGL
jgi:hypothetical protein